MKTKHLVIALIIYSVIFIVLFAFSNAFINQDDGSFEIFSLKIESSIVESYLASSLDNIIFFSSIGVILFLVSKAKPENDKLANKIKYIFPTVEKDKDLSSYLNKKISSLACIATESERNIDLIGVSKCEGFIKLSINSESHLKNIYGKDDFISDEIMFKVKVDPVPFDDLYGEISEIYITDTLEGIPKDNQKLQSIRRLVKGDSEFSKLLKVKIKPNKGALYKTTAWYWQNISETFNFHVSRYTEKQVYHVKNSTEDSMNVTFASNKIKLSFQQILSDIYSNHIGPNPLSKDEVQKSLSQLEEKPLKELIYTIAPGESVKLELVNVTPEDRFTMLVHQSNKKPNFTKKTNDFSDD